MKEQWKHGRHQAYNKRNKCLVVARLQEHKNSSSANNLNAGWEPKIKWTLRLEILEIHYENYHSQT
jgi:hypothetical protein